MTRLAWFTPLPPVRSGIATYNAELLPLLANTYEIDVFVEKPQPPVPSPQPRAPNPCVFNAHHFLWKHRLHPYDLIVYQLGNAIYHDYMWPYLVRYPGLFVLHDGQLHHARARSLLDQKHQADYRAELERDHPNAPADVAELGIQGLLGSLTYLWAMLRVPVESARLVAVHNEWLASQLRETFPDRRVESIRMGVADPLATARHDARTAVLSRHDLPADAVILAAFGDVTPEKRVPQIFRALPAVVQVAPAAHLLIVGPEAAHYDVRADARARGVGDRLMLTGYVDECELVHYLAAADVCLCLRWPTARETSASWLRCLAAGKPTVITDLAHTGDVPTLVTRGAWTPSHLGAAARQTEPPDNGDVEPVSVAIDILDEDFSLELAMRRLACDEGLRRRLGERARRYWQRHHSLACMAADYRKVIGIGLAHGTDTQPVAAVLPAHLLRDGTEHARQLLREVGASTDLFDER